VRINSQSGKGGAAYVMEQSFGYRLPKAMHPEFGAAVKAYCDEVGREITPEEVLAIFKREYAEFQGLFTLLSHRFTEVDDPNEASFVRFEGKIQRNGDAPVTITGDGNGPINAACNALNQLGLAGYRFVDYAEHAVGAGADATGVAYIQVQAPSGKMLFGVGMSPNINTAAVQGILCAVNRDFSSHACA
jgi:2-isopropylmalate synthase